MTEFGMALTNPLLDVGGRTPMHVGHPFPGVKTALMDLESGEIHQNPNIESELLV